MLPVLFNFEPLKIYTFGVFLVLAFFWGAYLLWKNIRLTSYQEGDIFDGLFLSLAGALFAGRLVHVVLNFSKFGFSPLKFILINGYPGISIYGFLAGGLSVLYIFASSNKMNFADLMNYFTPPALLALAFGKLGSFFSGVEVGTPTRIFLAVRYSGAGGLSHLTPFYESVLFFGAAYIAQKVLYDVRRRTLPVGFNFYFLLWSFTLSTSLLSFIRVSESSVLNILIERWLGLVLALTFTIYFLYYFRSSIFSWAKKLYGQKITKNVRKRAGQKA